MMIGTAALIAGLNAIMTEIRAVAAVWVVVAAVVAACTGAKSAASASRRRI
jgi:hypothetical protein